MHLATGHPWPQLNDSVTFLVVSADLLPHVLGDFGEERGVVVNRSPLGGVLGEDAGPTCQTQTLRGSVENVSPNLLSGGVSTPTSGRSLSTSSGKPGTFSSSQPRSSTWVWFGCLNIVLLLFADDVLLWPHQGAISNSHWNGSQLSVKQLG